MSTIAEQIQAKESAQPPVGGTRNKKIAKAATQPSTVPATATVIGKFNFPKIIVPKAGTVIMSAEVRAKALTEFRESLEQARAAMGDYVAQLAAIASMSEEEARMYESVRVDLEDAVEAMLGYPEPARMPTILAWADAIVRNTPEDRRVIGNTISLMVSREFLKPSDVDPAKALGGNGYLRFFGKVFALGKGFSGDPKAQSVVESLTGLIIRSGRVARERFEENLDQLKAKVGENPLSVADLKAGKSGRILLEVSKKTITGRDGEDKVLQGGFALVESDSGRLKIIEAAGGIRKIADRLAEAKVFIHVSQLEGERLTLKERLSEEAFRNILSLHDILRRGISLAAEKEAEEKLTERVTREDHEELEAMQAKATLSPAEFFVEAKPGIVLYDGFHGEPFEWNDSKFSHVRFLVERNVEGQIRVVEIPKRDPDILVGLLGGFIEFAEPGEKFYNLRQLGALLRIGWACAKNGTTPGAEHRTRKR